MNWSMPQPVLQGVAAVIGVCCIGSFALGVATAPARGRLPGERLDGVTGQPIQAQEATPLIDARLQVGPRAASRLACPHEGPVDRLGRTGHVRQPRTDP